jgi:hypothetical protein
VNKAVTLIVALLLLSGTSWAANTATALPPEGVRASPPAQLESPPMPAALGDAVLMYQDFNGTWSTTNPPPGWTITYTGSGPDANDWNKASNMAYLYWYPYDTGTDILMSPTIDCSQYTNIVFSCYSNYSWFSNYTAKIQGSEDGGTSWTHDIYQFTGSFTGNQTFALPWAAGKQLRLRWYGDGYVYNINYWYADNAQVTGDLMVVNDISVEEILAPVDPYYAFGDTIYPVVVVKNMGTEAQSGVPIRCRMAERGTGTEAYNELVYTDLAVGATDTLEFPLFYPVPMETVYVDTMRAENPGDQNPANDWLANTVKVTEWGSECMTYNDGTFDNAISWTSAGHEWACKFESPTRPIAINKAVVWLSSNYNTDYSSEVRIYGDDGSGGAPGTQLGAYVGNLHASIWTSLYKNEIMYDPPISVDYDSFFVSYYQTSISPSYPYVGMDYTPPVTVGNDWENYSGWYLMGQYSSYSDNAVDLGIEACYEAPLIDGSVVSIQIPAAEIDSNTTFTPRVTVKNAGLRPRSNMVVVFDLIDSLDELVYTDTVNTGWIGTGEGKEVDFNLSYTPHPGDFTDSAYTIVQWDGDPDNDWFVQPLFVKHVNVLTEILSPRIQEVPGVVPVRVKLVNMGNVPAMVPRLDVSILPNGYQDFREDIPEIPVGGEQVVELQYWVCPAGGQEVVTAWITYPDDMYPPDDTMIRTVTTGIPGWWEMTALPAPPSGKAIKDGGCMAYDAGTDLIYASKGYKTGDFYAYDVPGAAWATKAGIPLGAEGKGPYKGSVICSDGNGKLYLTKGNNTVGFWGYDAETDAWTQLTNVPFGGSGKKVKQGAGIAWGVEEGVGAAYLLKGYRNEFYKYDPETNNWTYLLNAPIGARMKWDAGSWLVYDGENKLYAHKGKYHEFYYYDLETDLWSPALRAMPIPGSSGRNKKSKDGSCAAWYGGKIYALKGGNTNEFWRYFPETDTWQAQEDIPLWGTSGRRKKVKGGAALAGYPGTGVYAFKGNKSLEFWRYTPFDVAGAQPQRDGVTAGSVEMGGVTFAIVPNPLSGGLATLRYSLPKAGLATLNVFDVTGRTVLTQTLAAGRTGTAGLDLRKLEAGVYLAKVTAEGFSATQKLVVEH